MIETQLFDADIRYHTSPFDMFFAEKQEEETIGELIDEYEEAEAKAEEQAENYAMDNLYKR